MNASHLDSLLERQQAVAVVLVLLATGVEFSREADADVVDECIKTIKQLDHALLVSARRHRNNDGSNDVRVQILYRASAGPPRKLFLYRRGAQQVVEIVSFKRILESADGQPAIMDASLNLRDIGTTEAHGVREYKVTRKYTTRLRSSLERHTLCCAGDVLAVSWHVTDLDPRNAFRVRSDELLDWSRGSPANDCRDIADTRPTDVFIDRQQFTRVVVVLGASSFQLRFQLRFQLCERIQYSHDLPLHLERRHGNAHTRNVLWVDVWDATAALE